MTARNGSAEWYGGVERGSGTITVDLETERDVPSIDEPQFQAYAEAANGDCPVSRALAGIPEITLTAKLLFVDTPRSAPMVAVAPPPLAGRWHQASTERGSRP